MSSSSLPIDPTWVWPGWSRRTTWWVAVLNRTKGSTWKGALYFICRSTYTTTSCFRPTPHRQPCVPRPKKAQTEGFSPPGGWAQDPIHPLPSAPPWFSNTSLRMASFFLFIFLIKIHKYCPLRGPENIWMLIPPFQWCLKDKLCQYCPWVGEVKHAHFKYLYDICLAQTCIGSVSLHEKV